MKYSVKTREEAREKFELFKSKVQAIKLDNYNGLINDMEHGFNRMTARNMNGDIVKEEDFTSSLPLYRELSKDFSLLFFSESDHSGFPLAQCLADILWEEGAVWKNDRNIECIPSFSMMMDRIIKRYYIVNYKL